MKNLVSKSVFWHDGQRWIHDFDKNADVALLAICPNLEKIWRLEHMDEVFKHAAEEIVESIVKDIRNRKGLKNEWDSIDKDLQQEICEEWQSIGNYILDSHNGISGL